MQWAYTHQAVQISNIQQRVDGELARDVCEMCQINIGGQSGLNCASCTINGAGKCDPKGCPEQTTFVDNDKICEGILSFTINIFD